MGKVYLVGAGFGTPEYMTLKSVELLKNADCVLYDALIMPECLDFCGESCEKIYVGKRKNNHHLNQDEINEALFEASQKYENVVRLKGGSPTVFGRGYEEASYLKERGVESEFIPGVSSSIGVAEIFGIPLVDRDSNDSFRVITGHTTAHLKEILTPYNDRENLLVLMGAHKAKKIVSMLLEKKGYPSDLPIAFLCKGGFDGGEKIVMSLQEAHDMGEEFFAALKEKTPLIIFVGKTAGF